jgi:hypothetical protein
MEVPKDRGLWRQLLVSTPSRTGDQYLNLDVDGDDVSDNVEGGCPASLEMADPCNLSIALSSGKEQFYEFPFGERFYLVRHRGRVYAVVNHGGPGKNVGSRSVVSIDKNGINLLCKKL